MRQCGVDEALALVPQQGNIIDKIINFAKKATIDGELIIQYDITPEVEQVVRKGICNGLSSMYLLSSFISDMQLEKAPTTEQEDDLHWFCKNIILLNYELEKLTTEQKTQLARFIGLIIHQQYGRQLEPEAIIDDNEKALGVLKNLMASEFTGQHQLDFDQQFKVISSNKKSVADFFKLAWRNHEQPLYLHIIVCKKHLNSSHAVILHRDKDNHFRFYDPNGKVKLVKLENEKDAEKFYISLVNMYAANDEEALRECGLIIHSAHPGPKTEKHFKI